MLGAMIGDIAGSRFEFYNHRSKDFILFDRGCFFTDDTLMTLAVAAALKDAHADCDEPDHSLQLANFAVRNMQDIGRPYPDSGYGGRFYHWIYSDRPEPYNSYGNGAAMRISPVGLYAKDEDELFRLADAVTAVSHNHPEGIKGAEAVALAVFLAKHGADKDEIRSRMSDYYPLNFTIDEIRPTYQFSETCQDTIPQALVAFLESDSFEDAIRTAVSVGGDSDTLAAITGSIAEAFYGVPDELKKEALTYLNPDLLALYREMETFFQQIA